MYWTGFYLNSSYGIRRANLDGSNVEDLLRQSSHSGSRDIALDVAGGKMYWTTVSKIRRANLDGSNVEDLVITRWNPFSLRARYLRSRGVAVMAAGREVIASRCR